MVTTIATFALGTLLVAFAVCAVFLNEAEHAARRRGRRDLARGPSEEGPLELLDMSGESSAPTDGRRLPVGDFLFGALLLRGEEALPCADLAKAAADSGMDLSQTLAWLSRAEESGIVERVESADSAGREPAVRLTAHGMDLGSNNRRGAPKSVRTAR
jgi:hypothetical protein